MTRFGETFDVEEKPLQYAQDSHNNVTVVHAALTSLNVKDKVCWPIFLFMFLASCYLCLIVLSTVRAVLFVL